MWLLLLAVALSLAFSVYSVGQGLKILRRSSPGSGVGSQDVREQLRALFAILGEQREQTAPGVVAASPLPPRQLQAELNELSLEVDGRLLRWARVHQTYWRICVCAGGAGTLLLVWDTPRLAGGVATAGALSAVYCWRAGRDAQALRRRVRQQWSDRIERLRRR